MTRNQSYALGLTAVVSVVAGAIASGLIGPGSQALASQITPLPSAVVEPKVEAHVYRLIDPDGATRAALGGTEGGSSLDLWDSFGEHRGSLGMSDEGDEPALTLFPGSGNAASFYAGVEHQLNSPYAVVTTPDGRYAWTAPGGMADPTQGGSEAVALPGGAEPAAAPEIATASVDEVFAREYIVRDQAMQRRVHLYTSADGGRPRAVFFYDNDQAALMLSVNEGGEADVRFIDSGGKARLLLVAGPDAAGWVMLGVEGSPTEGFLTQSTSFPGIEIPAGH